ncbi:hypothetical protein AJ79_04891 [Helicocarpus griseus UAMH5409]|uniref:HNH nuclease domain-containing protein n=1 Tax=Helicocarpus griseus UAMH5409 TaxID=1447875 RepID=A0A2B7XQZ7_9EURO|nr:hypothetical protein AJ79_04891 [Helicocarpus griseus UAMH5409]
MDKCPVIPPRSSSKKPYIPPEEHLRLLPAASRERLASFRRDISTATFASQDSTTSILLEKRIEELSTDLNFYKTYHDGLFQAVASGTVPPDQYTALTRDSLKKCAQIGGELSVLKKQARGLEQDLEEARENKRANRDAEPNTEFMERAYTSTIKARIMAASRQRKKSFDQSEFRRKVIKYLNAEGGPDEGIWCHLTGWYGDKDQVRAAHLVHKTLEGDELAHLFGDKELVISDRRNGLDRDVVVIVPIPPIEGQPVGRWMCLLVDQSKQKDMIYRVQNTILRWKDLDRRELTFRSENRPAKRFLYFRFIITYIDAKQKGNLAWVQDVESRKVFWATPGSYLRKSMLRTLARNISGVEMPPAIYEGNTFESGDDVGDADLIVAGLLRQATVESIKRTEEAERGEYKDDSEDDDEEDDEDDSDDDDEDRDDNANEYVVD